MSFTTSTFGNDALIGGFTDPVFDAQSVFKMTMDAMATFHPMDPLRLRFGLRYLERMAAR